MPHSFLRTVLSLAVCAACPALAQTAADLGKSLTPMGAISAANADGSIPAWAGGAHDAAGYTPGDPRPDPYAAEKPILSITAANVDQYAAKLAAGTAAMIRTLPGYHVDVYPTHRSFAAPQYIYDNAIANAQRARLAGNGIDVDGAQLSIPFPIPKNGSEAIWNHIIRWRGPQIDRWVANAVTTPAGDYNLTKIHEQILFPYNLPGMDNPQKWDSLFLQEILSPPRVAGQLSLVISHSDPFEQPRQAWSYNPGERRVRRAPELNYDTPLINTDGLATVDDYDMFNGAIDRYDWKLLGRREIFIPYNTYRLQLPSLAYADIVKPAAVNPDLIRFELHRVWVIEATLKPGFRHIYSKRTFYADEDSWQIAIADRYDQRGQLWRTTLAFLTQFPEVPVLTADGYEYLDLIDHRYLVQGLHSQERRAPNYARTSLSPADFSADALRSAGRR